MSAQFSYNLLVVLPLVGPYTEYVADLERFFKRLGSKLRKMRNDRGLSQEDMILYGFSGKHWQQLEAGRPITMTTIVRVCEALEVDLASLLAGLDRGIYQKPQVLAVNRMKKLTAKRGRKAD
jgi:transcriptional regulator with XRE-family HTH domain